MQISLEDGQASLFAPDLEFGKMCPVPSAVERRKVRTFKQSSNRSSRLKMRTFMLLNLNPGAGNLLGPYWEYNPPWLGPPGTLNTSACPRDVLDCSLSRILQATVPSKYYLSKTACLGILRRASIRGKELPAQLKAALEIQAGITPPGRSIGMGAYHMNQRDEGIDLGNVSGALMATSNMQMQTFVTGTPVAFAANQRDEVRNLHDIAAALGAQPGMKQQTFIAQDCLTPWDVQSRRVYEQKGAWPTLYGGNGGGHGYVKTESPDCLTPWDTQQERIFSPEGKAPTMAGADGGGGRNPAGLLFTAGFCAGAGPSAGGIGFHEELAPTLKGSASGNMMPSILCLNDQGGKVMDCTENLTGTLRAQEHGHQPLVFESHGQDSRFNGPTQVSQTVSASFGAGGNNTPLVSQEPQTFCIAGNIIDRATKNGGNGMGCQADLAYTITTADRHAVCSSYQEVVGSLCRGDEKGVGSQYVSQDKCIVESPSLIRRLTPMECERLQGFPDGWTEIPSASDSARYKALGNSVAIPCVDCLLFGAAFILRCQADDPYWGMLTA